jgi:hypothetical protein
MVYYTGNVPAHGSGRVCDSQSDSALKLQLFSSMSASNTGKDAIPVAARPQCWIGLDQPGGCLRTRRYDAGKSLDL